VITAAASAASSSPTCGRPRFAAVDSLRPSIRTPSAIKSEEIAEMVEWLRPVIVVISVREGCLERRTAEITIARFLRRKSSCRIPTVMSLPFLPPPALREFEAVCAQVPQGIGKRAFCP